MSKLIPKCLNNSGNTFGKLLNLKFFVDGNHPISFDNEGNLKDLINGDSGRLMIPEITVKPSAPETSDDRKYSFWLMREALRGGNNFNNDDKIAYSKLMTQIANQNEVNDLIGYDGTVYKHGNGALELVSPEFDIILAGGLFKSLGSGLLKRFTNKGIQQAERKAIESLEKEVTSLTPNFNYSDPLHTSLFTGYQKSGILLFKRPYTIEEIKASLKRKYNPKTLSPKDKDNPLDSGLDIELPTFSNRYESVVDIEELARQAGSKKFTVYGIVNGSKDKYTGFILGLDRVLLSDPAVQLMKKQTELLPKTTGELPYNANNWVLDIHNTVLDSKAPYIYFANERDNRLGGYFLPGTKQSFVNINWSNISPERVRSKKIHEGLSHLTDDIFEGTSVQDQYERIINLMDKTKFEYPASNKWYELRSTSNELKNKYAPDGNIETLKKKLNSLSDDELMDDLYSTNSYGRDYVNSILEEAVKTNNFNKASDILNKIRWGLTTLPATLPFIKKGDSK